MSTRAAGIALVLASTLPFALAGVFTRQITADVWAVLAWRGVLGGAMIAVYALWREGRGRMGWRGWALAGVSAAASMCFLAAFRATQVANVALIYTTAPFVAAGLDWAIRGARPSRGVLVAASVSAAGVAVVAAGSASAGHLGGDALAFGMTVLMALSMVMIRAFADVPVLRAMAAAAIPLALVGVTWGAPFAIGLRDLALLISFALSFALATVLLTEGARRLPAPEVALLGGLELPLVALFGVVLLGEWPAAATWVGGTLVCVAVVAHATHEIRCHRDGDAVSSSAR